MIKVPSYAVAMVVATVPTFLREREGGGHQDRARQGRKGIEI